MDKITNWIQKFSGLSPGVQAKIFTSLIVIIILWLIRTIVIRAVWSKTEDPYTRYRWRKSTIYPVLVTFESNWEKAKIILVEIAQKHAAHLTKDAEKRIKEASKRYMIFFTAMTPTVYTSVKDCGVLLTIRYLIAPRSRRGSEQAIWEEVLTAFSKYKDIDFAYPTRRFYDNVLKGKEDARAKPDRR